MFQIDVCYVSCCLIELSSLLLIMLLYIMFYTHSIIVPKIIDPKSLTLWHERIGHPGVSMMRHIIESFTIYPLINQKVIPRDKLPCSACSLEKLMIQPSPIKIWNESPKNLEKNQGDICGPIHSYSIPIRYFMVLINASTRWSHVFLLSIWNTIFSKLLA